MKWRAWGGYYSVETYGPTHDSEYAAIRYAVGVMDVSPLFKYEVKGKDAARFLSRVIAKNIQLLKPGQVSYCCWTDDFGKILDDGTVTCYNDQHFMLTAAEPSLYWFSKFKNHYQVEMVDISAKYGALALQGPFAREVLVQVTEDESLKKLGFFRAQTARIAGVEVKVSRTGYTGDLGYEIWIPAEQGAKVYDYIMYIGRNFGMVPFGLNALDVTRVEAGFIMNGVDYFSANHCMIESRKSTPYELGLGWTINLDNREPFVGLEALRKEKKVGSKWSLVGLVLDWSEQEKLFAKYDLPPQLSSHAWRTAVPLYHGESGLQIGQATSGVWSPILKQNLALAHVESEYAKEGSKIQMEYTVEYHRHTVTATVTKTPFFNPERKRA
jgi:aminomethyltransferase